VCYRYWTTSIFSKKSAVKNKVSLIIYGILLLALCLPAYCQTERWVFRYNGPADSADCAFPIVYGVDGNIYVAGYSQGVGSGSDFIVISLNKDTGDTNWIYRYNGPADSADCANSLVYGDDGNLYAAGYSRGSGTGADFTVISLTTAGTERWVYRHNGSVDSDDVASSIVYGSDGNLYVAGCSDGRFTIISLTDSGGERWVYRFIGPNDDRGEGYSVVYGMDGNIYAAGFIWDTIINPPYYDKEFTVVSVTSSGSERWIYRHWTGDYCEAYSIVYGGDGNIYSAGQIRDVASHLSVISLTSGGGERWVYTLPTGNSNCEGSAYSVVYGLDGNIYSAGVSDTTSEEPFTNPDFTAVSLTTSGGQRWVYRYDAVGNDRANSLSFGSDSNIYVTGNTYNLRVISLTTSGSERWSYQYDGGTYRDEGFSIVYGTDGNIYVAGMSNDYLVWRPDVIIISLNPVGAVAEYRYQTTNKDFSIMASTFQKKNLEFTLTLSESDDVTLSLCTMAGERVYSRHVAAPTGTSRYLQNLGNMSAGIYILRVESNNWHHGDSKKIIMLR
jgi:outer membrane protein assembly factor BamB